jgi:RNA polymerase sigma factor (sigma-70 family)
MTNLSGDTSLTSNVSDVAELFRHRHEQMTKLAYILTNDAEASNEIVQDAFLKVHANWDRIDNPIGYLRTAVINGCHSHHRHLRVERRTPMPRETSLSLEANEIGDALAKLPYPRRAVLALRFFCDLDDHDIAAILDIRPATVRSRIARGLADLRKEINR